MWKEAFYLFQVSTGSVHTPRLMFSSKMGVVSLCNSPKTRKGEFPASKRLLLDVLLSACVMLEIYPQSDVQEVVNI